MLNDKEIKYIEDTRDKVLYYYKDIGSNKLRHIGHLLDYFKRGEGEYKHFYHLIDILKGRSCLTNKEKMYIGDSVGPGVPVTISRQLDVMNGEPDFELLSEQLREYARKS